MAKIYKPRGQQHLLNPNDNPFNDHRVVVDKVDNVHQYKVMCKDCGCFVKWANETEYLWVNVVKPTATFRQLYWAPRFDDDYNTIYQQIQQEKYDLSSD